MTVALPVFRQVSSRFRIAWKIRVRDTPALVAASSGLSAMRGTPRPVMLAWIVSILSTLAFRGTEPRAVWVLQDDRVVIPSIFYLFLEFFLLAGFKTP